MSNTKKVGGHPLLGEFSFDEFADWNGPPKYQADFAEKRASDCEDNAKADEEHGFKERAAKGREEAMFWRSLNHLSSDGGSVVDRDAWLDASTHIDTLLARAKVSNDAMQSLFHLSQQIHEGLNALAANGQDGAAAALLNSLSFATNDFVKLAKHAPNLFIKDTRQRDSIPGLISQHVEQTTDNDLLVKLLHVAEEHRFKLPTKPARGRAFSVANTPANFWAALLIQYVNLARLTLSVSASIPIGVSLDHIVWTQEAMNLGELTPFNWQAWSEVVWKVVLETTQGKPEEEKHLFPLGKSAARKKTIKGVKHRALSQAANVRAEIKRALTHSIEVLACGPKSAKK